MLKLACKFFHKLTLNVYPQTFRNSSGIYLYVKVLISGIYRKNTRLLVQGQYGRDTSRLFRSLHLIISQTICVLYELSMSCNNYLKRRF